MNIALIGYRATGKSTVGRILAARLEIDFRDTDSMVEEIMAMPIREIVALKGWDFFRTRETETIKTLTQKNACVVATGGGVVLSGDNIFWLKQTGVIIWLDAPTQDIIDRLKIDAQKDGVRPQFTTGDIVQETVDTMKLRLPLYESAADYTVKTAGKNPEQVAQEIYQYLLKSGISDKIKKS